MILFQDFSLPFQIQEIFCHHQMDNHGYYSKAILLLATSSKASNMLKNMSLLTQVRVRTRVRVSSIQYIVS